MKLVILGATGLLGQQVVREAVLRQHNVLALVRNPEKFKETFHDVEIPEGGSLSAESASIFNADSMTPHFEGSDVVISCLGTKTFKDFYACTFYSESMTEILKAMESSGLKKIIKTGGWGLAPHPDSPKFLEWFVRPLMMYSVAKNHTLAEKMLENSSDVDYVIIRPPGMNDKPPVDKPVATALDAQYIPGCTMSMPARNVARYYMDCLEDHSMSRKAVAVGLKK